MKIGLLGHKGRMGQIVNAEIIKLGWQVVELSWEQEILKKQLKDCEGVIEFSSPLGLKQLVEQANIPLVLATTGLEQDIKDLIIKKSHEIPIFYSSNYSMGLFKLMKLLKNSDLDHKNAKIKEIHHIHKKDTPSGTALLIKQYLDIRTDIESERIGEVFGEHTIIYEFEGESLSMTHSAKNRKIFAQGALCALKFLIHKTPGLYSMNELIMEDSNKS
jgi:4-hydroxy-tetrahydrodipicolinate reductase